MIRRPPCSPLFPYPPLFRSAGRLPRGVSAVPAGTPAGRALVNLPAAYTVVPTTAWDHTTPSTCTVGSGSAVTVVGVAGSAGTRGAESARAVPDGNPPRTPASTSTAISAASSALGAAVVRADIWCIPPVRPSSHVGPRDRPANTTRAEGGAGIPRRGDGP